MAGKQIYQLTSKASVVGTDQFAVDDSGTVTWKVTAAQILTYISAQQGFVAGVLGFANGGTAAALTAANGAIPYSTASALAFLAPTSTAGQMFRSGSNAAPSWSTATYPATIGVSQLLYASSANVIAGLATGNNGVLTTGAGGIPAISSTLPTLVQQNITTLGTLVAPITFQLPGGVNAGGTISSVSVAQFEGNYSAGSVTGSYGNIAVLNDRNQNEAALFGAYRIGAGATAWLSLGVRNGGVDNITAIMDSDGDLALNSNCYATAFFLSINPFDTVTTGATKAFFLNSAVMAQNTNAHLADPGQADVGQVYLVDSTFVSKGITCHTANGLLTPRSIVSSDGSITVTNPAGLAGNIGVVVNIPGITSVVEVTGTSQNIAANTLYIANNAGLVTFTIPVTIAQGACFQIIGKGAGGWKVNQQSGQTIHLTTRDSTTGTGGSISSQSRYDCMFANTITANTDFVVSGYAGNLTIV